jgi:hypothetical protein
MDCVQEKQWYDHDQEENLDNMFYLRLDLKKMIFLFKIINDEFSTLVANSMVSSGHGS